MKNYTNLLEKSILNFHYNFEKSSIIPIYNIIKLGLNHSLKVLLPIDSSSPLQNIINDRGKNIKFEDSLHIGLIRPKDDKDAYYIPVFTSENEHKKGSISSLLSIELNDLISYINRLTNCLGIIINPTSQKFVINRNMLDEIISYKPKSHIELVVSSVVDMNVDIIVNAANISLLGGGGVDGEIHKRAGHKLIEECKTLGGCKTGDAKITASYNIKNANYIVHTVGPIYMGLEQDSIDLANCYKKSLDLAKKYNSSLIAFPGISTGVYGYPLDEASEISLNSINTWIRENSDTVINIYLCCFKEKEYIAYKNAFSKFNL